MQFTKDNQMLLTDDNGVEHMVEVLFTYENEERQANYVLYYLPENPEEIFAARYEGDQLIEITDEEEYDEVEEVLNAFLDDPEINQENKKGE